MSSPARKSERIEALLLGDPERMRAVYGPEQMTRLEGLVALHQKPITHQELKGHLEQNPSPQVILSTWGMPLLTEEELDLMPDLQLVLYAAGDVRGFSEPLVKRGIEIVSAWRANAVPVAEFTLAQILLSAKGWFRNSADYKAKRSREGAMVGPGCKGVTVALIGAGAIAQLVIAHLKGFDFKVLIVDPYLSDEKAAELGVTKVSLSEAFEQALIVSNHVPNNASTQGMIGAAEWLAMPHGGTFINTGRGQTLRNDEFYDAFKARPDLTALLDVTHPEPLPSESPIWNLPNVHISTHIAGAIGQEVWRMSDLVIDELELWLQNKPLNHLVEPGALPP
jgi:phosphoglycerate dehydrogenase-like enzyme